MRLNLIRFSILIKLSSARLSSRNYLRSSFMGKVWAFIECRFLSMFDLKRVDDKWNTQRFPLNRFSLSLQTSSKMETLKWFFLRKRQEVSRMFSFAMILFRRWPSKGNWKYRAIIDWTDARRTSIWTNSWLEIWEVWNTLWLCKKQEGNVHWTNTVAIWMIAKA